MRGIVVLGLPGIFVNKKEKLWLAKSGKINVSMRMKLQRKEGNLLRSLAR